MWSQTSIRTRNLSAVWGSAGAVGCLGSASTAVWAVGEGGAILHWDGTAWSSVSSGTTSDVFAVWGSASTDVWTVGYGGTILHWDGTAWSSVSSGTTNHL